MAKPTKSKQAQRENAAAAARVLAFYVERNGRKHGAKQMMADDIGANRQSVDAFISRAIPRKYVAKLAQITGWSERDILPNP